MNKKYSFNNNFKLYSYKNSLLHLTFTQNKIRGDTGFELSIPNGFSQIWVIGILQV